MNKYVLFFIIFISSSISSYAQTFPFTVQATGPISQNIRNTPSTTSGTAIDGIIPGNHLVANSISGGWYYVSIPHPTAAIYGYCLGGSGFMQSSNISYITVQNASTGLQIKTSAGGSSNVSMMIGTTSYPSAKVWNGQRFACTGTNNWITIGNVTWYQIYLTINCSQSTGWISNGGTINQIQYTPCTNVTISNQPQNLPVTSGSQASFTVAVNGTSPFSFFWYKVGNSTAISSTISTTNSLNTLNLGIVTTANDNEQYYCNIINCAANGGIQSNTVTLNVSSGCAAPTTPTISSSSNLASTSFTANWNLVSSATAYYLDVSTNSTFSSFVSGYNNLNVGNTTNQSIIGLNCNTTYYYRVRAGNTCGTSGNSSFVSTLTSSCCTTPNTPIVSASSSPTTTSFNANWLSVPGATNYYIDLSINASFSSFVYSNQPVGNTTTYSFTGLSCNTNYYYRVRASNSCGTSGNSTTVSTSTNACSCATPGAPTAPSGIASGQTTANLSWSAGSPAGSSTVTYYWVIGTNPTVVYGNGVAQGTTTGISTTATGLTCGVNYYLRVYGSSSCNGTNSGYSTSPAFLTSSCSVDPTLAVPTTIISPLGTPTGLGCECIVQNHFTLPHNCPNYIYGSNYTWEFNQRGDCTILPCSTCTAIVPHGENSGGIPAGWLTISDERFAWDINMTSPNQIESLDKGQNVYAVEEGYIMNGINFPGWGPSCLNCSDGQCCGQLLIRHSNGSSYWYSGYVHMEEITNKKLASDLAGRHVMPGEIIGVIGKQAATNYHLHFGVYYLDPISNKLRSIDRTITPRLIPSTEFRINTTGSIVSGAKLFIKRDSIWKSYGQTDENGNLQMFFMPNIHPGDSIKINASGYEEMIFSVDSNLIVDKKLIIPLMQESTPTLNIKFPKIIALNQQTFYSGSIVPLKITGLNFTNYDIIKVVDFGDSTAYNTIVANNSYSDSLVNISLIDSGINTFLFRLKGIDTVEITKSFLYAPNTSNFYTISLTVPSSLIGAKLYVEGSYIKDLVNSNETLNLLNGIHSITVQSTGFRDTIFLVNSSGTYNLILVPIINSSTTDSSIINFPLKGKIQYYKNVTLMDSALQSILCIKQYDDTFTTSGLIPISRKFEFIHLNSPWSNVRFAAVLNQVGNLSKDSIYLMRIYDDSSFTKIAFDNSDNLAGYDSIVQKLTYNYIDFNSGTKTKEALVIMKKQAPKTNSISFLNVNENSSLIMPLSYFFNDPDSIKNDMTFQLGSSSSQLTVQLIGDSVKITPAPCWNGKAYITILAQHDSLWNSIIDSVNVQPVALPSTTLISPGTSSTPGNSNSPVFLTFNWNTVTGNNVNYKLTIRKSPYGAGDTVFSQCVGNPPYTLPNCILQYSQNYRWNIQTNIGCSTCEAANSSDFYFKTTSFTPSASYPQIIGYSSGTGSHLYGPIVIDSISSALNYSRHAYIYTPSELAIPTFAKIIKLEWLKKDGSNLLIPINTFRVWMKNTNITSFDSTESWGNLINGCTLVYQKSNFSFTQGNDTWKQILFNVPGNDSFTYAGNNIMILVDWIQVAQTGVIPINFYCEPAQGKCVGIASHNALTTLSNLQSATYGGARPTIRINYLPVNACTGIPITGSAISSASSVCPNIQFTLSIQNMNQGAGMSYVWQRATDVGFTSGVTTISNSYSFSTTETAPYYYRCVATCNLCGSSGTTYTSSPVYVPLSPFYACYCKSYATSANEEDIFNFTFSTLNNSSNCDSIASGTGSVQKQYSNYQNITPPNAEKQTTYPFSIEVGSCGNSNPNRSVIFIDYNHNGYFDSSELVYQSTNTYIGAHTESGSIDIPSNALTGLTGIRVITSEQSDSITDPCLIYFNGETEDYLVDIEPPSTKLNLKLFIQGCYIGANTMAPALMNQGVGVNNLITDTIIVELRNEYSPYGIIATVKAILHTDGTATCTFPSIIGNYYVAVRHRNGLQTWSSAPVAIGSTPITYDFTNAVNKAYGNNQAQIDAGVWAFYSGDLNSDENIDLIDLINLETDVNNFQFGYFNTDINGDGNVDLLDSPIVETNINNFIFSKYP